MSLDRTLCKAVLTADIQDFSSQMLADEQAVVRLLVDTYYAAVDRQVERHGGHLLRKEGDAVWCLFDSAAGCLRAAVGIQEELFLRNFTDGVKPLLLRVGAHLGELTLTSDGEVLGHTLSVAKRLESRCPPGGICVSDELYVRGANRRLGFDFENLGRLELKGIGALEVWQGSMTAQRRQALEAQAGEKGRAVAVPRLMLLADCQTLTPAHKARWDREALRVVQQLDASLIAWDDNTSVIVAVAGERALTLLSGPSLAGPRRLLAAGEVLIKLHESGEIEELYGSALEQALDGLKVGRQHDSLTLTAPAAELVVAAGGTVEPWDSNGVQGVHLYRWLAPGLKVELAQSHQPRRITSAVGEDLVDLVVGTRRAAADACPQPFAAGLKTSFGGEWRRLELVVSVETSGRIPTDPTLGLALLLAALASRHRDSLPAGLVAVGEVRDDGTLVPLTHPSLALRRLNEGLVLAPPGAGDWGLQVPVVELVNLKQAREWMLRSGSHGHSRLFAEALSGGRLCMVLAGPLGGATELADLARYIESTAGPFPPQLTSFPQLAEEVEEELGRATLLQLYRTWCDQRQGVELERLLAGSNLALLVSLFPDPRLERLSGSVRTLSLADDPLALTESDAESMLARLANLSADVQRLLAGCTLLLVGCRGAESHLKGFFRQLRQHNPRVPTPGLQPKVFYLAPDCGELEERWWERREVELLRESAESVLTSASLGPSVGAVFPPAGRVQSQPRSPYKFLQPYARTDGSIFFGREEHMEQLLTRLLSHRVLIVYGKSGVGKTSLLQAGVHSRLRRPGHLMVSLRVLSDPVALIRSRLRTLGLPDDPGSQLLHVMMNRLAECISGHLVVSLDQFEEFFVRQSVQARQGAIAELAETIRNLGPRCHVVFSLREDFLAQMSEFEAVLPTILDNRFRVCRLTADQARQAILGPARLFGLQFDEEVVEDLISQLMDMGIDPPDLQISLDLLVRHPEAMQIDGYRRLGGVLPLLVSYLQATLDGLGAQRGRARSLLQAMVGKAVVSREELSCLLGENAAVVGELLERLVAARLVRTLEEGGEPRYELAHEYVLVEVQSWIAEAEVDADQAGDLLRAGVAQWQSSDRLLSANRLALLQRLNHQLHIGVEERALLLRSAALHGCSLESWLGTEGSFEQRGVSVLLAMLADRNQPPEVRRAILECVFVLPLPGTAVELLLQTAEKVGNPYLLERLSQRAGDRPDLLERFTERVRRRFFGPQRMARVPAGPAWLGSTDENKAERMAASRADLHARIQSERAFASVEVDEFSIDRTLVTNQEYAEFRPVHRHYFTPEESQMPVVYASYYDALAYCEWAGKQLPGEEQWEKAARGTDGRLFPWGNEFAIERLNSAECGRRSLSVVTDYPEGASPYGCLNMSGLVWEWTSTPWESGSPLMTRKGGSGLSLAPMAQCSARFEDLPELVLQWVGFRASCTL